MARDGTGRTARDWARRYVVATGKGQAVVNVLKEAEEREKREKNMVEDVAKVPVDVLEGVEEKKVEDDPRFTDRAPCVPRVQQQPPASASPACHAV